MTYTQHVTNRSAFSQCQEIAPYRADCAPYLHPILGASRRHGRVTWLAEATEKWYADPEAHRPGGSISPTR